MMWRVYDVRVLGLGVKFAEKKKKKLKSEF